MNRNEASSMIQGFFRLHCLESPGLNEQDLGGAVIGESQIYFEYQPADEALKCSALIYKFQLDPKPGLVVEFIAEEPGTDTGGGAIDYEPENRGLYLSRWYGEPVPPKQFANDLDQLMKAAKFWGEEVLDRVAARVFHPEELLAAN